MRVEARSFNCALIRIFLKDGCEIKPLNCLFTTMRYGFGSEGPQYRSITYYRAKALYGLT